MKKNIIVSLIIGLIFTNVIFSQNDIRFGINAGLTFSKFKGNESFDELDVGVDVLTGISLEMNVNENISLKTNLNYERKSMYKRIEVYGTHGGPLKTIYTYGNITMPIMLKYKIEKSNNLYFNAGPFVAYLLHRETKSSGYSKASSISDFKKFDFGLSFGMGTKIKLDKEVELDIELRENLGLMNISKLDANEDGTIKTRAVNLILTMGFNI